MSDIKTIWDIPENIKIYQVILSDGLTFYINGIEKKLILSTQSQFIETKNGEVFNKSFIKAIILDKDKTKENAIKNNLLSENI